MCIESKGIIEKVHRLIEAFENTLIIMNSMSYCGDCGIEMTINIDQISV